MSGTDKIISRLQEECEEKCREIEAAALAQAEQIISEAGARAENDATAIRKDSDEKADRILDKAKSAAAMESRRALLSAKVEMIDGIIEKALNKLHNLDAPSYFAMLKNLAEKNAEPQKGIMFLSKRDLDRLPPDFAGSLTDIDLSAIPCDIEDGFILKYGDIEINCTLRALVNAHSDELKSYAGSLLFEK